jgi:hypothetical protein
MKLVPVAALLLLLLAAPAMAVDLRAARAPVAQLDQGAVRHSHGVTFRRFHQELGGVPVLGSEVVVTDARGRAGDLLLDGSQRLGIPAPVRIGRAAALRIARRSAHVRGLGE